SSGRRATRSRPRSSGWRSSSSRTTSVPSTSTDDAASPRPRPTSTSSSSRRPCSRLRRALVLTVVLALAFPAGAAAHARLVGSKPADGAVLATSPPDVKLLFDDHVRPAGGDRVIDAKGRSVPAGPAHLPPGNDRALVLPLRPRLARGAYTARWQVVSDDGHVVTGVLAFAVGTGLPRPVPTLSAGGGASFSSIVLRCLFLGGILVAGGSALTGRFLLEPTRRRVETMVVGGALVRVRAGGFGRRATEPPAAATRFGRVPEAAAIVASVGVGAALASTLLPPLGLVVSILGAVELAAPTLAGHALDPRQLRGLIALADFVHVVAAAVWIGGLVLFVAGGGRRARARFPAVALAAVGIPAGAAFPRPIAAFPSPASVVPPSYGQAVLVKTGLLAAVLLLAWSNRRRFAQMGPAAELVLLAGLVVAIAVLTDLRPPQPAAAARATKAGPPAPPPADAVVLGGRDDGVAVGFAASPRGKSVAVRVTALGEDGNGIDGLSVDVAGGRADACGSGCYARTIPLPGQPRRVDVRLEGPGVKAATLRF